MSVRIIESADSCFALCGIEGCPRTREDGQDEECGLLTVHRKRTGAGDGSPHPPECGAVATIDLWEQRGLLTFGP